jgi:hypothetical protein
VADELTPEQRYQARLIFEGKAGDTQKAVYSLWWSSPPLVQESEGNLVASRWLSHRREVLARMARGTTATRCGRKTHMTTTSSLRSRSGEHGTIQ